MSNNCRCSVCSKQMEIKAADLGPGEVPVCAACQSNQKTQGTIGTLPSDDITAAVDRRNVPGE